MKRIGITQRVENIQSYAERRDCLDQRWSSFAEALDFIPCPLPNISEERVSDLIESLKLDAILLSGGNSISYLNPIAEDTAPERDKFETALLEFGVENNVPIVGVCRGMQMINVYFGGELHKAEGHVAVRHAIRTIDEQYILPNETNSYHDWCIASSGLAEGLCTIAVDSDGCIEAYRHMEKNILGIMWHPEREQPFNTKDINLLKRFLL